MQLLIYGSLKDQSILGVFWNDLGEVVRNKLMHDGLSGFLKGVTF